MLHLNPKISDPQRITKIPTTPLNPPKTESHNESNLAADTISNGNGNTSLVDEMEVDNDDPASRPDVGAEFQSTWKGLRKDIGILTEKQFQTIVAKCISTLGA